MNLLIGYYEGTLSEKEKKILRKKINSSEQFRDEFYEFGNLLRSKNMKQWDTLTEKEANRLYETVMLKINNQNILNKFFQLIIALSGAFWKWLKTELFKMTNRKYAFVPITLGNANIIQSRTRNANTSHENNILILHKFNSFISKLSFEIDPESKTYAVFVYMYKDKKIVKNIRIKLAPDKSQPVSRLITKTSEYFDELSFGKYSMEAVYNNVSQGVFSFVVDENGATKDINY